MQLHSISYMSSAVRPLTREELDHLLERARYFNAEEDVTGVLFYSEGGFHQYLEGPLAGLERIYARILASPLHRNILELLREPIAQREFTDWSMAFRAIGMGPEDVVLARLLDTEPARPSTGRILLSAYWEKVVTVRGIRPRA